jgi:pre-mRNA cleavage complex 2 protein Pcf11
VLQSQKDNTVHLYASLSASAQILTDMLHQWKVQQENGTWFGIGEDSSSSSRRKRRYSLVRKEQFTTEGIKEHNDAVIARLYEVGLPFLCSADGRRFATQLELSNHLDAMFRKSQLDKTMEKMEERGWYLEEKAWERGGSIVNVAVSEADETMEAETLFTSMGDAEDDVATSANTVVADESRDRCILCGINFAMFFDQEDGEWKYRNCVEKDVEVNDGPTMDEDEAEAKLVHYSCWKGLGSPAFLTADQVLHAN